MNKKAANIVEYIVCILITLGLVTTIVFAIIQNDKKTKNSMAQQMGCDFNLRSYIAKEENNQAIINYLYEQDMRGEINLDSQTIFMLGKIN